MRGLSVMLVEVLPLCFPRTVPHEPDRPSPVGPFGMGSCAAFGLPVGVAAGLVFWVAGLASAVLVFVALGVGFPSCGGEIAIAASVVLSPGRVRRWVQRWAVPVAVTCFSFSSCSLACLSVMQFPGILL